MSMDHLTGICLFLIDNLKKTYNYNKRLETMGKKSQIPNALNTLSGHTFIRETWNTLLGCEVAGRNLFFFFFF